MSVLSEGGMWEGGTLKGLERARVVWRVKSGSEIEETSDPEMRSACALRE